MQSCTGSWLRPMGLCPALQEAYAKQQERIILETSRVYWRGVTEEPLTLEGVKTVTLESFINIFEVRVVTDVRLIPLLLTLLTVEEFTSHVRETQNCTWGATVGNRVDLNCALTLACSISWGATEPCWTTEARTPPPQQERNCATRSSTG